MARCPICGKTKPHKKELLEHIEDAHQNEIPENMSTAQYVYSLTHDGRSYGLCRSCGKPTEWNEKTGKPMQLCGSPQCKAKMNNIAKKNMLNKYGKTTLLNDPKQQQLMLANRKISGEYHWSDHKHAFSYTGTYEKFTLEWLDKIFNIDPDQIKTPGPTIKYKLNGVDHFWITDMYISEYNLVIEIKDGNATGDKNTHPGFAHNRELERAKDIAMQHQTQFNYLKLTNKNMIQLLDTLNKIRLNNIFNDNDKSKPVLSINETADEFDLLNENIAIEKLTGNVRETYLKIVSTIKDVYNKWNGYNEISVSKDEKTCMEKIIKTSKELIDDLIDILEKDIPINYEVKYSELLDEVDNWKKIHKKGDQTEFIKKSILENHLHYLESSLKKSIRSDVDKANVYRRAIWYTISRTLYVINQSLYGLSGKGVSNTNVKKKGINSKRYGSGETSVKMTNLSKSEAKPLLEKLRKSSSYSESKKYFKEVCDLYDKTDISAIKLLDLSKINKLVFVGYKSLKPMILKAGTKLYHISACNTIDALNPVYKCRDDITFYSTPRVYFTDKMPNPKWVLPNVKDPSIYEYTVPHDMKAYRGSEYGSWYHNCLYVESDKPLKVKNITDEFNSENKKDDKTPKTQNESINLFDDFDNEYDVFMEDSSNILEAPKKTDDICDIENNIDKVSEKYKSYSDDNKIKNAPKILNICKFSLKMLIVIMGADRIVDGVSELYRSDKYLRIVKENMPMNHETYNKIKHKTKIKHILNIIHGIISTILTCYTSYAFITKAPKINKILSSIGILLNEVVAKYSAKYGDSDLDEIYNKLFAKCNKINALQESINECYDTYNVEESIYETISNDNINLICENISNGNYETLMSLNESIETSNETEITEIKRLNNDKKDEFKITCDKLAFNVGELSDKDKWNFILNHYFGSIINMIHKTDGCTVIISSTALIPDIRSILKSAGLSNVECSSKTSDVNTPMYRYINNDVDVLIIDDSKFELLNQLNNSNTSLVFMINTDYEDEYYKKAFINTKRDKNISLINIHAVNSFDNIDENIMSIANISPISTTMKFSEIKENEPSEFEKNLEKYKILLNESVEDLDTYASHFCPETLDDFSNTKNPIKDAIKNRSCIVKTVKSHKGRLFIISDTHIFGKYDDDPNHIVNAKMVNYIIDNINKKVKPNDTLLILGDICHRDDKNMRWHTKWFLEQIKCKNIWLVLGNHDLCTPEEYHKMGCSIVCHKLLYNGYEFTHYPIKSKFNIHGHIHYQSISKYDNINHDNHINAFYYSHQDLPTFEELLKNELTMNESNFDMSGVIFGDGEFSSICDSRIDNFVTGNSNEDIINVNTNMFSPNIEKTPYDYIDVNNNFSSENEEIRMDLQIDPGYSGESDSILPDIAKSIYSSNFNNI